MSVGIALVDKNGHVITSNEADCRFLGYSLEEMAGMHFSKFTHPEDLDIDTDLYNATAKGERKSYTIDKRYVRKDGEIVWRRLSVSLIRDNDGTPRHTVIVYEDITERKLSDEALKKYESIVSTAREHMSFVDKNYVYKAVNDSYLKAHNKKREEILGFSVPELLGTRIFEEIVKDSLDRCLEGEEIHYESWFDFPGLGKRYMDVAYYPFFEADGSVSGLVVNSRDITERKQAEEQLKEYAAALEKARDNLEQKVEERTRDLKEAHEALVRKEKLAVLGQYEDGGHPG